MLRLVVAEADKPARDAILALLRPHQRVEIVAVCEDGGQAVQLTARLRPDLVLMGVKLRTMDGVRATNEIMIEFPTPILLLDGRHAAAEVDLAVRALRAGALAVVTTPLSGDPDFPRKSAEFLSTIEAMAGVKVVRRWRAGKHGALPVRGPAGPPRGISIVAVASSTGGPTVLETILSRLPGDFPAPILIVQHIAAGFVEGVASWLDQISPLKVQVARHGDGLAPGRVFLAPDDQHLGVSRTERIVLSSDPPIGGFRPSANYLFASVAREFGDRTMAVVLTGMGRDGVDSLGLVRREGGRVIAQDEATSVVFGMPRAAIEEGLVDRVLPTGDISRVLQDSTLQS